MNKKIIELVQSRLDRGAKKYGKENLVSDGREFVQEALEEALDLAIYVSMKLIEIKNDNYNKILEKQGE